MTKIERNIVQYLKDHSVCVMFWAITFIGLAIRFFCRNEVSIDATKFLIPWYEEIHAKGVNVLAEQIGDYNILYQFCILLFTFLPIKPIYAYKLFSVIFDFALALTVATIMDESTRGKWRAKVNSALFVTVYSVILISPLVFLNSSAWAQCDSIYAFFVFLAFYALIKKKHILMFVALGMAFAFKLQTILVMPFFLIIYVLEMDFSIFGFCIIPVVFTLSGLPGFIKGRSILDPLKIYYRQTGNNCGIWMNNSSFWNILAKYWSGVKVDFFEYKMTATLFTIALLGLITVTLIRRKEKPDRKRMIELLHITVYTCVLFLPGMHDRYGYIYEITAILLVFFNRKYLVPCMCILMLTCMQYGYFLFGLEYNFLITSFINTLLYGWYAYQLLFKNEASGADIAAG